MYKTIQSLNRSLFCGRKSFPTTTWSVKNKLRELIASLTSYLQPSDSAGRHS